MKRVWFAVIFITLCAALCTYQQAYVKESCDYMEALLDDAQRFEEVKSEKERDEKINELQEYWKKKNDFLFIFSEHQTIDELALNIRSLDKAHNMKSALAETKTLVIIYYENERITLANIF